MNTIRLGIIGCGIAARELHLPALRRLKNKFTITAVCNHTEPKARSFSRRLGGVPYVTDYRTLLLREDVDAVDIALPIELNYPVTLAALKAGKHVFVEKPIAATLREGRRMLEFPRTYRRVMMVGENFRYRLVFMRIGELLRDGAIGRPYAVEWNVIHEIRSDNKYALTRWRRHHRYEGGFITDAGVHNVAALRLLFGEIVRGGAWASGINRVIGTMDTFSFQFVTDRDVKGILNLFFTSRGFSEHRMLILGTKGALVVEENAITLRRPGMRDRREVARDDGGYGKQFEDFHAAITGRRKVVSTFREGYRDLEVILTAIRSARP
jgi:predicted dehydrogenase